MTEKWEPWVQYMVNEHPWADAEDHALTWRTAWEAAAMWPEALQEKAATQSYRSAAMLPQRHTSRYSVAWHQHSQSIVPPTLQEA